MPKTRILNFLHAIYHKAAGEHPEQGARDFIRHLGWIGISFALAKVISGLLNIFAARMLGPGDYGKLNLLISTGTVFSTFLVGGMNYSIVRYGVSLENRARVFSTGTAVFIILAAIIIPSAIFCRTELSHFFAIDEKLLLLSLCYAAAAGAFLMLSSMQQSSGSFSGRGFSEILFSLLLCLVFFLCYRQLGRTYESMAYAYLTAFSAMACLLLYRMRGSISLAFVTIGQFVRMYEYGFYYFGACLGSFFVLNVQSLVINAFLAPKDVGVYAAYYTATISMAGYVAHAITTVLFPKASASNDRNRLWNIGEKGWKKIAPAAVLCFIGIEIGVLFLMGRHQYEMNAGLMLLFAIGATLVVIYSSMGQIIFSEGIKAARLALAMALVSGAMNFMLCVFLVPRFKIFGVAGSLILTYSCLLLWLWQAKGPYLRQNSDGPDGSPSTSKTAAGGNG